MLRTTTMRRLLPLLLLLTLIACSRETPFYDDKTNLLVYLDGAGKSVPVSSEKDWKIRREHILANAEKVMGEFPRERRPPLNIQVLDEMEFDGYTRRKISYDAKAGDPVPAYLYLPTGGSGRRPAALALHPTGALGKGIPAGVGGNPNRAYAHELARRGWVVLAPDYPYMGDPQANPYDLGYASGTMKAIYNHSRGIDLLVSLPEVDGNRIAAIGHSLGGHNSIFIAVFDERVGAVVTSCGFNAFPKYYGGDLTGWSSDKYMPRVAEVYGKDPARMPFDFPELIAAIAPRAIFISAPLHDENFEVSGVEDCVRAAAPVYETVFAAGERLVAVHPDCGHDFPEAIRAQAYEFLERSLKAGD